MHSKRKNTQEISIWQLKVDMTKVCSQVSHQVLHDMHLPIKWTRLTEPFWRYRCNLWGGKVKIYYILGDIDLIFYKQPKLWQWTSKDFFLFSKPTFKGWHMGWKCMVGCMFWSWQKSDSKLHVIAFYLGDLKHA